MFSTTPNLNLCQANIVCSTKMTSRNLTCPPSLPNFMCSWSFKPSMHILYATITRNFQLASAKQLFFPIKHFHLSHSKSLHPFNHCFELPEQGFFQRLNIPLLAKILNLKLSSWNTIVVGMLPLNKQVNKISQCYLNLKIYLLMQSCFFLDKFWL